jgi:hypothetical protein
MRKKYTFILLFLAAMLMSMSGRQGWIIDPVSNIDENDVISPKSFAFGPDQTIHVVFERKLPGMIGFGPSEIYYTSKSPGKSWSLPQKISPPDTNCPQPTITVTPEGDIYVSFLKMEEIDYMSVATIVVAKKGQDNWTYNDLNIIEDVNVSRPVIISDQNGDLHLAFNAEEKIEWTASVYYATNSSGEWSAQQISNTPITRQLPDLSVSDDGVVHILFVDDEAKLRYVTNNNARSNIWDEMVLSTGKQTHDLPMMSFHDGEIHVIIGGKNNWDDLFNVIYLKKSGEDWTNAQQISDQYEGYPLSMAFDSEGKLFVAFFNQSTYFMGDPGNLVLIEYFEGVVNETMVEHAQDKYILGANLGFDQSGTLYVLYNEEVDFNICHIYMFISQSAPDTYAVNFTVNKIPGGEPIHNAQITLGDLVNPEGDYVFQGLTPGIYNYSVSAEAFYRLKDRSKLLMRISLL